MFSDQRPLGVILTWKNQFFFYVNQACKINTSNYANVQTNLYVSKKINCLLKNQEIFKRSSEGKWAWLGANRFSVGKTQAVK